MVNRRPDRPDRPDRPVSGFWDRATERWSFLLGILSNGNLHSRRSEEGSLERFWRPVWVLTNAFTVQLVLEHL